MSGASSPGSRQELDPRAREDAYHGAGELVTLLSERGSTEIAGFAQLLQDLFALRTNRICGRPRT